MLRSKVAALAMAVSALVAATPACKAGEVEHASATIGAIERDMQAVNMQAGYFYAQMSRAQMALQWHARMKLERGAQMDRSGCTRPPSPWAWNYCAALYRDLQEHARLETYWISVAEANRANHLAAVNQVGELSRADYWWKTRLAMLQSQRTVVAGLE